jgi:hypothetical protein
MYIRTDSYARNQYKKTTLLILLLEQEDSIEIRPRRGGSYSYT